MQTTVNDNKTDTNNEIQRLDSKINTNKTTTDSSITQLENTISNNEEVNTLKFSVIEVSSVV